MRLRHFGCGQSAWFRLPLFCWSSSCGRKLLWCSSHRCRPSQPNLRLGGSLLPPLCLVVASRAATQVRSSPNARASLFRSTVGQEPKSSLSLSLYLIVSASLCFLSIYLFSSYPFFVSNNNDCTTARWQRMATRSKRRDQNGNPEVRVVAHQPRKNLFALLLSALIHKRSLSVGYLRALSCSSRQNKQMKMLVDLVLSRGFLTQKIVTTISHNVYKGMLPKINLSHILSTLFRMNLPMTSNNPTNKSPELHHMNFTCFAVLAFVSASLPQCAHKREYAICRSRSFRAVRRLSGTVFQSPPAVCVEPVCAPPVSVHSKCSWQHGALSFGILYSVGFLSLTVNPSSPRRWVLVSPGF